MRNKFYTLRICSWRFSCAIFSFGSAPREGKRGNDGGGGKGERERPLYSASLRGRQKRGGRRGREKARRRGKGKGLLPSLPNPPPFFPFSRYPQPLSTPATQAKRPPAFSPLRLLKRWRFFSLGTSATTTAATTSPWPAWQAPPRVSLAPKTPFPIPITRLPRRLTSPKSGIHAVPNFVVLIQTLLVSGFVPKPDILLITFFNPI